jgi:flagellar hook-basal body complex protein FliE
MNSIPAFNIPNVTPQPLSPNPTGGGEGGFLSTLKDAMGQVEGLQAQADQQVSSLLEGNGQDVHGAMIAVERADLSFQLMMQVRNKIVNAYQEISRMQF